MTGCPSSVCYFPSGSSGDLHQEGKYRFLEAIYPHLMQLTSEREFILVGDVNIAHREADLKNWKSNQKNSGFLPEERAFPWWLVILASPFVATLRELLEMRYLWREAVGMSNAHLTAVLGFEPHTPLDAAVQATLEGMGCLPPRQSNLG